MWMRMFEPLIPNHLHTTDLEAWLRTFFGERGDNIKVVRKLTPLPCEAIVRGYLTGSALEEARKTDGLVGGYRVPRDYLIAHGPLPQPIFTPTTKAEVGQHDMPLSKAEFMELLGEDLATQVEQKALSLYNMGSKYALERGIIVADTKFEFAQDDDGQLYLIDEVLTPDSSRFWPVSQYVPGHTPPSFDKQFVRDYLTNCGWDKKSAPPVLPQDVVQKTVEKYAEAERRLLASAEST
jgi:phosphoribosylaminoimidazole-succinocarboxamide synthase